MAAKARAQKGRSKAVSARLPRGFAERRANVDGVTISDRIGGRGPVVLLLHGFAQTGHVWRPLMPLLAASHAVIAPDLRGAGGSARPPAGYDKKPMARDMHGLVRQLGHQRVAVLGHGIGLMVAYAYAAQYPGEVGKVVLLGAFLPVVGDWKSVWLLRDLWHFHFYRRTPLALVKVASASTWSTFGTTSPPTSGSRFRRRTVASTPRPSRAPAAFGPGSSTSRRSSRTRATSRHSR